MCGMICISVQGKKSALKKLEPMIKYKMTSSCGIFTVLFRNLHLFSFWSLNTVTDAKKSLTFFILSILISFVGGTLLINWFQEDTSDDPDGVFSGFSSQVKLYHYAIVFTVVYIFLYEILKNLFIRLPVEDGMVELNEVPLQKQPFDSKLFLTLQNP